MIDIFKKLTKDSIGNLAQALHHFLDLLFIRLGIDQQCMVFIHYDVVLQPIDDDGFIIIGHDDDIVTIDEMDIAAYGDLISLIRHIGMQTAPGTQIAPAYI